MRAANRSWWIGLTGVAILAPLPLGAIEPEWLMPMALAALTLGGCGAVVMPMLRGEPIRFPPILTPLALLAGLVFLQSVPLPNGVVRLLSPERLTVPPVPGDAGPSTLSVYPGATREQAVLLIAAVYLLWAISGGGGRAAARVVAVVGVAHALLGLSLAETGLSGRVGGTQTTRILGVYTAGEVLAPFGSYVNKNHFAGLMLVGAGGLIAIFLRRSRVAFRHVADLGLRARLSALSGRGFFRLFAPVLGLLLILVALFASGSRGAALAFVLALVAVPLATGIAVRRVRIWPVLAAVLLLFGVMMAASAGRSQSVIERLVPEGRYLNRPKLWRDVLAMTARYPVAGVGAGTFEYAFPRYQVVDETRRFTHAEGDWVQHLAETGVTGGLLLATFAVFLLRRFLRQVRAGGTNAAFAVGIGVGLTGLFVHGLVDTGLHMPANLLMATILVGGLLGGADRGKEVG